MYSLYKTDKNMKLVSREEEEIKEIEKLKIMATIRLLALQGLPEKMSDDYYKILTKEGDLDSEDLLRMLAERVFSIIKNYPELMRELKKTYFKDL